MYANSIGAFPTQNRKWDWGIEKSQDNIGYVPAMTFRVDEFLPVQTVDPYMPAGGIVIPAGRFVSHGFFGGRGLGRYRVELADKGATPITLHGGANLTPAGMSTHQLFKNSDQFGTSMPMPTYKRGFDAEVPFVLSVNNAHGALLAGDRVTSYFGQNTTATAQVTRHTGKPAKWIAKTLTSVTASASAVQALPSAILASQKPTVVAAYAAGALLPAVTNVLAFDGSKWIATFSGTGNTTVTTVQYTYGQETDQIAGEVLAIRNISDLMSNDSFFRYVEDTPNDFLNLPPSRLALQRFAVTPVSQETPATVVANVKYKTLTAPAPISVYHPVIVEVANCTIALTDGTTATYASGNYFALPTNTVLDTRGYFIGLYHSVNWYNGVIDIMSNIQPISGNIEIRVSYSYQTDRRDGAVIWGGGQLGLTDGRNIPLGGSSTSPNQTDYEGNTVNLTPTTSAYGVRANLNFADVVAAMRIMVK